MTEKDNMPTGDAPPEPRSERRIDAAASTPQGSTSTPQHGGRRPGAGRAPKYGERMPGDPLSVRLRADTRRAVEDEAAQQSKAKQLAEGNPAAIVRPVEVVRQIVEEWAARRSAGSASSADPPSGAP